ncbi:DUF3558 domain-containing protein [Streptomyces sp. NBC_01262]|uniref:DUF3558 domain-containing protein n=1 Tax=Streptomyces sp. NBC_01262 TaxID=2903803 RepID=UPI002E2F39BF|nr:DUF3558 domain-containing protein [Streptomyces sp. NBC_01262]
MQRSAPHRTRLLACAAAAAVPVMLIAGCSSTNTNAKTTTDGAPSASPSGSVSGSASPSLAAAEYAALPEPCKAVTTKTVKALVPKVKNASGVAAKSTDPAARGGCSWNGLDGFQYRWLDVALQRFDSVAGIGSAESQAVKRYEELVTEAKAVKGATAAETASLGDEATTVTAKVTKDKEQYQDVTVIARTGNVAVILTYNGAGFETAKTPKAAEIAKDALTAAKEAVASVAAKNA